jgi:hypothetical protein
MVPGLTVMSTSRRPGAYGFALAGVPAAEALLVDAPERWPELTLVREDGTGRPETEEVTADHARLWLAGGAHADIDRAAGRALVAVPPGTTDGALVHPYLAPVALIMSRWLGREGMHGGGVVAGGGVWAVLGHKTAGKSTMLAWLASSGVPVFSDDVLVIDDGIVLAGPRSIDLRREAARRLGAGEPLGRVGARSRWRLPLGPVPAELPLKGWITLEWGDEIAIRELRGAERLAALLPHRGVRLAPTEPGALLRLSTLPHLQLVRPRRWGSLPDVTERLVDAIAG